MSNAEFAKDRLYFYAKNACEAAKNVVYKIVGPTDANPLDLNRLEHLGCELVSQVPVEKKTPILAIDYSPEGDFTGKVRILQRDPRGFANGSEYDARLDEAFKDAEILKLIA